MEQLSSKQAAAIKAMVEDPTLKAIKRLRVSKKQIATWLKDNAFKDQLDRERLETFREGLQKLQLLLNEAVDVMRAMLKGGDESSKRLAAKETIDLAMKSFHVIELDRRLEALEKHLAGRK
jgi:hypothetical protein